MKHTQILQELAAKENIHVEPAEENSLEELFGSLADKDKAIFVDEPQQSPESAALDAAIQGSVESSRVAVIPAIDRQVDPEVPRGPIDIRVGIGGSCHVRNPA